MVITSTRLLRWSTCATSRACSRALVDAGARAPGRYVIGGPLPRRGRDVIALMDELTGRRVRRVRIPGPLLRALGRARRPR